MLNDFRDSPQRAPHWRWLRALQIDKGGPRASRTLDGAEGFTWIRRAVKLKRHFDLANSRPAALYALLQRDRDLFWAHSIWIEDKAPTRWAIEARILAGETDESIAAKLGIEPSVVAAFAHVFFDIREKMAHTDYILNVVLADAVTRGLSERQYDLLWKLMGYHGGEHTLSAIIGKFTPTAKPEAPDAVAGFFQDFAVNTMKYKAALAALTVQVNSHTQLPLIDSFVKYVEIERTTANASKAHSTIVENIGAMLAALPFRVGTKLDSSTLKMLPFDNGAAELRNDELMTLAVGGDVQDQKMIQELRYPEATDAATK